MAVEHASSVEKKDICLVTVPALEVAVAAVVVVLVISAARKDTYLVTVRILEVATEADEIAEKAEVSKIVV